MPVPVYGAVPPFALTVTTVLPPKQAIGAPTAVADNKVGCVTPTACVDVQPLASVTLYE